MVMNLQSCWSDLPVITPGLGGLENLTPQKKKMFDEPKQKRNAGWFMSMGAIFQTIFAEVPMN